eukprot:11647773-Alexandrium_andersonii.AAC.1
MSASLVGSEMCIRDSSSSGIVLPPPPARAVRPLQAGSRHGATHEARESVSYTHLTLPTICSV